MEPKPELQFEQLICSVAPSRIEVSTRFVIICCCCERATLVTEATMSACVVVGDDTRYQSSPVSVSLYLKPLTTGSDERAKALASMLPPSFAEMSRMPFPVV